MPNQSEERFLRLPEVLERITVSKSTWWAGVKTGKYPKPVKLSTRTTAWRRSDIDALCARIIAGKIG
jgi:prophage regulatory protein